MKVFLVLMLCLLTLNIRAMPFSYQDIQKPKQVNQDEAEKVFAVLSDGRIVEGTSGVICDDACARVPAPNKFDKRLLLLLIPVALTTILLIPKDGTTVTIKPIVPPDPITPTPNPNPSPTPTAPVPEGQTGLLTLLGFASYLAYRKAKSSIWLRQSF